MKAMRKVSRGTSFRGVLDYNAKNRLIGGNMLSRSNRGLASEFGSIRRRRPDILKPAGGLAMARLNESCAECHRDQTRPFVFEHEALREGCVSCHQPHGSINAKLLVQRDANLCLKCHAQMPQGGGVLIGKVDHSQLLRLGSCWSAGCHTAVHGSNINPKMLY